MNITLTDAVAQGICGIRLAVDAREHGDQFFYSKFYEKQKFVTDEQLLNVISDIKAEIARGKK